MTNIEMNALLESSRREVGDPLENPSAEVLHFLSHTDLSEEDFELLLGDATRLASAPRRWQRFR
jgi:hypothetical protein